MDSDIEELVKSFAFGMEAHTNQPQVMDSHWTYPEQLKPWIHVDFKPF